MLEYHTTDHETRVVCGLEKHLLRKLGTLSKGSRMCHDDI